MLWIDRCMQWLGKGLTLMYISRSLVSLASNSFASAAWLLSALALKLASRAASSAWASCTQAQAV